MATNILDAINDLTTAITNLQTQITTTNVIDVSPVCCDQITTIYEEQNYYQITVGQGTPPSPYVDWPTYQDDLCKRAWTAVLQVEQAMNGIYDIAGGGVGIAVGVIIAVLAIIEAPFLIALEVLSVLTGGGFVVSITLLRQYLTDIQDELVCAIYTAETVEEAAGNIGAVLLASPLDPASITILTLTWHRGLLNSVFDGTLTIDPTAPTDCDFCSPQQESCPGCLTFETGIYDFIFDPTLDPAAGSVQWVASGRSTAGALELTLNPQHQEARAVGQWCDSLVVQTGDIMDAYVYVDQSIDPLNAIFRLFFTDMSQAQAPLTAIGVGGWYHATHTITGTDNGKTVDYTRLDINKTLNNNTRIVRFDDVCVTRP